MRALAASGPLFVLDTCTPQQLCGRTYVCNICAMQIKHVPVHDRLNRDAPLVLNIRAGVAGCEDRCVSPIVALLFYCDCSNTSPRPVLNALLLCAPRHSDGACADNLRSCTEGEQEAAMAYPACARLHSHQKTLFKKCLRRSQRAIHSVAPPPSVSPRARFAVAWTCLARPALPIRKRLIMPDKAGMEGLTTAQTDAREGVGRRSNQRGTGLPACGGGGGCGGCGGCGGGCCGGCGDGGGWPCPP